MFFSHKQKKIWRIWTLSKLKSLLIKRQYWGGVGNTIRQITTIMSINLSPHTINNPQTIAIQKETQGENFKTSVQATPPPPWVLRGTVTKVKRDNRIISVKPLHSKENN